MIPASPQKRRAMNEMLNRARRYWGRAKGPLLIAIAAACAIALFISGAMLTTDWLRNRTIAALAAGKDIFVAVDAAAPVAFARATFLLEHDRLDEAEPFAEAVDQRGSPKLRAALHYNLANARLRIAMEDIVRSKIEPAIPLVSLARQDYRRALRLDPTDWDAKYNTDVADRLIRDFPSGGAGEENHEPLNPKKLWTEVPGKPEGLP
ncbi:MAG: MxaK protein [Methylocella sp.]